MLQITWSTAYCVLISIAILAFFDDCEGRKDRTMQDAWIWPGLQKYGVHMTFSDTADWSDILRLRMSLGFYNVGRLCVRGVFIIYDEPNFQISSPDGFDIVSGNIRCYTMSDDTKSIQMVGSVGSMNSPSITFYEKPDFTSFAFPTSVNVGSEFFQNLKTTHSAIIIGRVPWTVQLKTGQRICLLPDFDAEETRPICLVRDFRLLMEISENGDKIERVTQGCKANISQESVYKIQDCRYWGRPSGYTTGNLFDDKVIIMNITNKSEPIKARSNLPKLDICSNAERSNRVFQLYKVALGHTPNSLPMVEWPKLGKNVWKLELIDFMFEIVTAIPNSIIPNKFLTFSREIFISKLAVGWKESGNNGTVLTEKDLFTLQKLTKKCVDDIKGDSNLQGLIDTFTSVWMGVGPMDNEMGPIINPEFARSPDRDILIDTAWLVGHIAGYFCHSKYEGINHFWALFFKTFEEMYMVPLKTQWKNPDWKLGLNLLFGGINYEVEYDKLSIFTDLARTKLADNMEPLKRPLL